MHMADALITPVVGGVMYLATLKTASTSIHKLKIEQDDVKLPMMGVMGAFVFATQMINITIPGTGSSGHLGGGLLLAAILGPYAGFLAMAAILTIQALFFADGGLLALGCNIFNMGFFTCFVAYPFIYRKIVGKGYSTVRIIGASMLASVAGLQLGAFGVVAQTVVSGKLELSPATFAILMQSIHLAIGIVEGLITAAVLNFLWKARPELLDGAEPASSSYNVPFKRVVAVMAAAVLVIGGILSWYASSNPDGLEWSLYQAAAQEELAGTGWLQEKLGELQNKTALMPDYEGKEGSTLSGDAATSTAGILGGGLTLLVILLVGWSIKKLKIKTEEKDVNKIKWRI